MEDPRDPRFLRGPRSIMLTPVERFTDTHAHLDFPEFSSDIEAVVHRAREAGIHRMIAIGCDLESSRRAIALAERFDSVWAAVGWHPNHLADAPPDVRPDLQELARHPRVVAIGECGVDHYRLPSMENGGSAEDDRTWCERQNRIFRQQLEVAADTGLNVIVHQRAAFQPAMEIFTPFAHQVRAVFHCFVGTPEEMQAVLALGSRVSFTGISTFKNASEIRRTLQATPDGGFFFETDCPFLAPTPHRGKRAEPAHVRLIAEAAAQLRATSLAELSQTTEAAVNAFFPRMA